MRGLKTLLGTTALLAGLALVPSAQAQVVVNIGAQPVCSYGYYGYAPYRCAPVGYYGPGYFYNGIFLGMGPWGGWGYSHGWGSHRFVSEGGGNYHGGPGRVSYRDNGSQNRGNAAVSHGGEPRPNAGHAVVKHTSTSHAADSHASKSHANASHSGGEHASGEAHEGGGKR
jgi:hypothetical protein